MKDALARIEAMKADMQALSAKNVQAASIEDYQALVTLLFKTSMSSYDLLLFLVEALKGAQATSMDLAHRLDAAETLLLALRQV